MKLKLVLKSTSFCYNKKMKNLFDVNDWNDVQESQRIGEILIESGKINLIHLSMALDAQKFQKIHLGEIFILMNVIEKNDLEQALSLQEIINSRVQNEYN